MEEFDKMWEFVEGNLSPDDVQLLMFFIKFDLQRQEVARIFHINRSTFTYRFNRCIKRLRYEYLILKLLPSIEGILSNELFKTFSFYLQQRNQTLVSRQLNISQAAVSQRLTRVKKILFKKNGEFKELGSMLNNSWRNCNDLKKIYVNSRIVPAH